MKEPLGPGHAHMSIPTPQASSFDNRVPLTVAPLHRKQLSTGKETVLWDM